MKFAQHLRYSVWLVAAVVAVSSCGDRTATGPAIQASASTAAQGPAAERAVKNGGKRTGLLRCAAASEDDSDEESEGEPESEVLGPEGGTIGAGPASLVVPRGSLTDTVTITVEVTGDTVRAVRLLPQGLVFQQPAYLVLSYGDCKTTGNSPKRIAYTSDAWTILEYEQSWDDPHNKKVTGELNHFSNYAVAW
ncbi:MAG: hypothetical protein DMD37_10025 [Gemmatimonadetes bacterium]|nr:MAG: hypothetical protein DMD37_10025 [Gemmatimonadota bacterium]